jgi:hypothetical protein
MPLISVTGYRSYASKAVGDRAHVRCFEVARKAEQMTQAAATLLGHGAVKAVRGKFGSGLLFISILLRGASLPEAPQLRRAPLQE